MLRFVILFLFLLQGCTYFVAKETVKVVDIILEDDPNPEKKKKILEKQKIKKIKLESFIVVK